MNPHSIINVELTLLWSNYFSYSGFQHYIHAQYILPTNKLLKIQNQANFILCSLDLHPPMHLKIYF